jgi:hypothetical protein
LRPLSGALAYRILLNYIRANTSSELQALGYVSVITVVVVIRHLASVKDAEHRKMTKPDITTFDVTIRNAVDVVFDPPAVPGKVSDADKILYLERDLACAYKQMVVMFRNAQLLDPDFSAWMDATACEEYLWPYKDCPIGNCDACWREAPLKDGTFEGCAAQVCAWGCEEQTNRP